MPAPSAESPGTPGPRHLVSRSPGPGLGWWGAMATWRRDVRLTGSQRLLCAGLAGVLSLSLTAPLELATVLAQVGVVRGHGRGPWAAGLGVWRAEGPRALWKGNAVACLRLFPYSAVQLTAYRKFVVLFMDDLGHISQWSAIMAGSLAGMVSTIVTYPTDLIKTRLIVQNMLEPSYRGILHAFSTVYQQEGFLALYRGVSLTVLELCQHLPGCCGDPDPLLSLRYSEEEDAENGEAQSPFLPRCGGVDVHFSGATDCFRQIVKAHGVLGLWNGLAANLLKVVPYFGVMFGTFEFCKRICLYHNGYIVSPLSYKLTPGVDQSLKPQELRELKKFFKTGKLNSRKPTL
ncbi:solute carrier family 25 member 43 isoform X3 [Myotis myotis]|uniref:solute carrier family 25 member 43 isoform X3 n=1 Tax=Myotis myotis TaxID=51298 RepID=UPI00174C1F94|nr:solute carrier family 25 member 43 isoform X3 [Myotis myotis]